MKSGFVSKGKWLERLRVPKKAVGASLVSGEDARSLRFSSEVKRKCESGVVRLKNSVSTQTPRGWSLLTGIVTGRSNKLHKYVYVDFPCKMIVPPYNQH